MKVGLIVECAPEGTDKKVYEYLARRLDSTIEVVRSITLINKKTLIELCGESVKALLEIDKCEKVIIAWDLEPSMSKHPPCRFNDCQSIKASLDAAQLTAPQLECVHLICVEKELETLLLADNQAIEKCLCKITGQSHNIKLPKNPEYLSNPKKRLNQIFKEHTGRMYEDRRHAEEIAKLAKLTKLRRCSSFARFAAKLQSKTL
ncbi:MAG TPA: DUF4276 family protein [Ktedonobacteraceae bacterium]|nr:DUF4276 family protein [Ktedonobacteraceae bacterium]